MSTAPGSSKAVLPAMILALSLLVSGVYWQVGGHSFVRFDDDLYVYENPHVLKGLAPESISWAFATFHGANWHPLTWLSHMADVEWFGLDAGWHHRVNVLLHLANTILLFLVLWRMTGGLWQSAFVAALFAVHPLHVESVAWVAERKDLLSTLFWLLTMGAYLRYTRNPGVARYLLVAACLSLGLMCKPMLVTLPFVLLLLDGWPLRRFGEGPFSWGTASPRIREKIPLLALSAASCVLTYLAQSRGSAVLPLVIVPPGVRISNALVSCAAYLGKTLWPASLAVLYPHPVTTHSEIPPWQVMGALLLLGGLSFLAWRWRNRRPYLAMGWLWYLGTLVPVIGLVQVGVQAHADRYTYVPLIGVFIAIAWGVPEALGRWRFRRGALAAAGGTVALALAVSAWSQAGYWRNSVTLFTHSLRVTEKNWLVWGNLGLAYDELGQPREAIACYREALRLMPGYAKFWYNMGVAYDKIGQPREAISSYGEAVRIQPDYVGAWFNMGSTYDNLGQPREAIASYREALRLRPNYFEAWGNLGVVYDNIGQHREAIACYLESVRIKPDNAKGWYNLGVAYSRLGRPEQAIRYYVEASRIVPDFAQVWYAMGIAYSRLGQREKAREAYQRLLRIDPSMAGKLLAVLGPEE